MAKFVLLSDLHYVPLERLSEKDRRDRKLMHYAGPLLEKLTAEINEAIRPDFVVNLGDLIQDYGNYDEDVAAIESIWRKFAEIDAPCYTCVGNHDLRATKDRGAVAAALGYERTTYSVDVVGVHLVVLGTDADYRAITPTGVKFEQHRISPDDLAWLKADLVRTELPTIVCLHFGVAEDDMEGNYWFGNCPEEGLLGNRRELKKILKNSGKVKAVFSGHQHWTKAIVEEGIPYYVVGSMTENYHGDGVPDGVYLMVSMDGTTVKTTTNYIRL